MAFCGDSLQADPSSPSQFGPGSNYTPPAGLASIPGVNAPCLSQGGQMMDGIDQFANIFKSKGNSSKKGFSPINSSNNGSCTLGGRLPKIDDFTCNSFPQRRSQSLDGLSGDSKDGANGASNDPVIGNLKGMLTNMTSCDMAVESIQGEVTNCLMPAQNQMSAQLAEFSASFGAALGQAHQAVATQQLKEKDVANQIAWINDTLTGSNGGQNLLGIQAKLEGMVNSMDPSSQFSYGQVRAVEQAGQNIQQQQAIAASDMTTETMSYMRGCFESVQPDEVNLRCTPNGPPVSPLQYIQCAFNTNGQFVGGQLDQNTFTQGAANANTQGLSSILDSMLGQIPSGMTYQSVLSQNTGQMLQSVGPQTLQAIQQEFVQYISSAPGSNQTIQNWVTTQLQNCYAKAYNQVVQEQNNPASTIGKDEYNIQQLMTTNTATFNSLVQAYSTEWAEDAGKLWPGSYNPANIMASAGCNNATLSTQSNCLESLHSSLQGILTGAGQPAVQITGIPSNFPGAESPYFGASGTQVTCSGANAAPNGACQCSGVIGCVQMYQNIARERATFANNLANQRTQYVNAATQYLTNNVLSPSQQMATQIAQQEQNQVQQISMKLQSEFGIQDQIQNCTLTPGKSLGTPSDNGDGLPTLPDGGAGSLLTSCDLSNTLPSINSDLAQATDKIGREKDDLSNLITQVKAKEQSCLQNNAIAQAVSAGMNFIGECPASGQNVQGCTGAGSDAMTQLLASIGQAQLEGGGDIPSSLESGITQMTGWVGTCSQAMSAQTASKLLTSSTCGCGNPATCTTSCQSAENGGSPTCINACNTYQNLTNPLMQGATANCNQVSSLVTAKKLMNTAAGGPNSNSNAAE